MWKLNAVLETQLLVRCLLQLRLYCLLMGSQTLFKCIQWILHKNI